MQSTINTLRWAFIGVFAVIVVGLWTYQIGWIQPRERCEAAHRWWDDQDRKCAIPVAISVFTGRPSPGEPAGELIPRKPSFAGAAPALTPAAAAAPSAARPTSSPGTRP